MFTWISKPAVLLLMLTGLAACQPAAGLPSLPALNMLPSPKTSTEVLDGALRVVGPRGYCPDSDTLHSENDSAVVLLGRCFAESKAEPALVSVTVGQPVAVAPGMDAELASFFASDAGRATLSARGRAADIDIVSALSAKGMFLIQIRDRDQTPYWRAMTAMAGRMVSVRANGPTLSPTDGRKLVEATVAALRRANGAS